MAPGSSHSPAGQVDRTVLVAIEQRLKSASHVRNTVITVRHGKATLLAHLELGYFPREVEEVYYHIRWYTSGDFEIHYQENWTDDREWKPRWDRHPRDGKRTHLHPPPDAGHPPRPVRLPTDYYDVLGTVESDTIDHIGDHPLHDAG